MPHFRCIGLNFCGLLLLFGSCFGQATDLPLNHWAYPFLERLQIQGFISSAELQCRPVSREILAQIVGAIDQNQLSQTDALLLEQLKGDLAEEITLISPQQRFSNPKKHFYRYADAQSWFLLDLYGEQSFISDRRRVSHSDPFFSMTTVGAILRGTIGHSLGFYLDAQNQMLRGTRYQRDRDANFDPSAGLPLNITGRNAFQDRAVAYFSFGYKKLAFKIGQDEMAWGSGLTLNANWPSVNSLQLATKGRSLTFHTAQLSLNRSMNAKQLAVHRLDWQVTQLVKLGVSELLLNSDNNLDALLCIPFGGSLLNTLFDRGDHAVWSLDAMCFLRSRVKIYGELLIDQANMSRNNENHVGSQLGFLAGAMWSNAFRVVNLDARLEFCRIGNRLYQHSDSSKIFLHYDRFLGPPQGPGSDRVALSLGYQLGRDLRIDLGFDQIDKDPLRIDLPNNRNSNVYTTSATERRRNVVLGLSDQLRRDIYVRFFHTFSKIQNVTGDPSKLLQGHVSQFQLLINF